MPKSEVVSVKFEGGIAWVTIGNPPANAASAAVRKGLRDTVEQVQLARAAILTCTKKTLIALPRPALQLVGLHRPWLCI